MRLACFSDEILAMNQNYPCRHARARDRDGLPPDRVGTDSASQRTDKESDMADLRTCPVCNMDVNPADAPSETFRDQEYSFCSETCREQFLMDPERYARA